MYLYIGILKVEGRHNIDCMMEQFGIKYKILPRKKAIGVEFEPCSFRVRRFGVNWIQLKLLFLSVKNTNA